MAAVIEIPSAFPDTDIEIIVETQSSQSVDGVGFNISRARAAKAALDEARIAPGSQTGDVKSTGALLLAASMGTRLEYFAGHSPSEFERQIRSLGSLLTRARQEVSDLISPAVTSRGLRDNDGSDPEILFRVTKALSLLDASLR